MSQTPPTLISYNDATSAWTTGAATKSSASISWQTGDVLVVVSGAEAADTLGTPTATGLSFTKQKNNVTASTCAAFVATAVAASASSGAVSVTNSSSTHHWGFGVWVWRGSDGVGNSAEQHTATHNVSLTAAGGADSAICWGLFDFGAAAAGTLTPTPTHTRQNVQDGATYTLAVADLTDQVSASGVVYGYTGSGGGPFSIVVVEVKGAAGGGGGTTLAFRDALTLLGTV